MNTLKLTFLSTVLAIFSMSCGGSDGTDAVVNDSADSTATTTPTASTGDLVNYYLNTGTSVINWEGSKPTGSKHNGTLKFQDGEFIVIDGELKEGRFTVDMNSLENEDLKGKDGYDKLVGHLKSEDFFGVEKHPTSSFQITGVEPATDVEGATHKITGNLIIKDISQNITFPATVNVGENTVNANAEFVIDRSLWNVTFGSTSFFEDLVGDKVISNDIQLNIKIQADRKTEANPTAGQ